MKDIYELLNELNIDFSEVEEIEISEIERARGKRKLMSSLKKNKSGKKKITIAASLLLIVSLLSITLENPTWAGNIPIIGDLVQNSFVNINKEYADYLNTIGQTKSHEGIDVTFENAVADNNMFAFSFVVRDNNVPIEAPEIFDGIMTLSINGKEVNMSGVSQCEVVDKNTVKYLMAIDWEDKALPRYLNVNLSIPQIFNKSGDWGVKFTIDTKEIEKQTYTEKLNKKFSANNINFVLDKVSISPLTTNIQYYAKSDDSKINCDFLVLDQDNNEVKFMGGTKKDKDCEGGEEGKVKFNWNYINNSDVKALKLIPRYHNKNYEEKVLNNKKIDLNNFSSFEVKLSDNMSIYVDDLFVDNGNLIVRYNYKYLGKPMKQDMSFKDLGVKEDGVLLNSEDNKELWDKYKLKDKKLAIYKIGDKRAIEMEFYDGAVNELLENEAVTIVKN